MAVIHNPVLKGFNPDPSILRVGDDYYLATSTFEWFPGVPLYHSRDLANWHQIGHALTDRAHCDLIGVPDSGGIWAPSLSYDHGRFFLLYTIVRNRHGPFRDTLNYLMTAETLHGPWSAPVFLNASGFDPALLHDDDGRKWLVNVVWDQRKGVSRFGGIVVQEYDVKTQKLVGPIHNVLKKADIAEGPNLYKLNGYYYLMLAEGGTGWLHNITMARSKHVTGPYELDPQPYVLTSRDDICLPLQKAGHGELVQTQSGEWYLAHLCSRPVGQLRRCILGRETAIQKVQWKDGWLRLASGTTRPAVDVPGPADLKEHKWPAEPTRDDFDAPTLRLSWQTLRGPVDDSWLSLTERPGHLRLRGRESYHSLFEHSFVGRRLQSVRAVAETCVEFAPTHYSQMAGMMAWYNARIHYYLRVTHLPDRGKVVGIVLTNDGAYDEIPASERPIADWKRCHMRAVFGGAEDTDLQFYVSPDGQAWEPIGPVLDAGRLSDDYGSVLHFTGTFVGLCAQDVGGTRTAADFDYFDLQPQSHGRAI